MQLVSAVVPYVAVQAAAAATGGIAADGAVGQRCRAVICTVVVQRRREHAAAIAAELPLTVQLVSVAVPLLLYRPPPVLALPPVIVSPDSDLPTRS